METNSKIDRILVSGKSVKPVDPNPYLFNKIMQRLKNKAEETYHTNPVLVWASLSALVLLIAVNVYMLTSGNSPEVNSDITSVANAYGITNQGGLNYE